ncbi:MAG: hypothetical protein KIT72_12000 [Polyangiaceae bacterium]|nr:hypothetical protein [Polyangiaceae bacterium]MCW5791137.1 hypothetical protein [Polyangiaceae bacterium]
MKLNFWYLAALLPIALVVGGGAFSAQFAVLGITLGIFFGTLSLRKPRAADATGTNPGL